MENIFLCCPVLTYDFGCIVYCESLYGYKKTFTVGCKFH